MTRDYIINGATMVTVKGRADSGIGSLQQLGLPTDAIQFTPTFQHKEIKVDAWGDVPPEVQFMLAYVDITINLIHVDQAVLDICLQESMAGAPFAGALPYAGARLGNGLARFAGSGGLAGWGNHYIGLNLASPVNNKPWCFLYSYMTGPPFTYPLGTEKSVVSTHWRAIPYTVDPWNGGLGSYGSYIWTNIADN